MKIKNKYIITVFIILLLAVAGFLLISGYHIFKGHTLSGLKNIGKDIYYCPMHPGFTSDRPGDCAICGMKLVKQEALQAIEEKAKAPKDICILHNCRMANCQMQVTGDVRDCPLCGVHLAKGQKILYYRNPMNPEVTSPVPLKDSMGMDYLPVYEEETNSGAGIYMSPQKQQLIGVTKEKTQKRKLTYQILTVGKVAYDPALYIAQEEYLQALKTQGELAGSSIAAQGKALLEAAGRKLLLLGMNKAQIEGLVKQNKPQGNLYLPTTEDTAWVYITIYEYEAGFIKTGLPVEIETVAFPGEIFNGKISAITPVLDSMTRSVQVRAEVDNPDNKLKPEMFVNVKINVDLGEALAVPEAAVLDTGTRKIVYLVKEADMLEQREVTLGQKAQGYYVVLKGLAEGDQVVTSGNFLVDSESKLRGATQGSTHKHGQ